MAKVSVWNFFIRLKCIQSLRMELLTIPNGVGSGDMPADGDGSIGDDLEDWEDSSDGDCDDEEKRNVDVGVGDGGDDVDKDEDDSDDVVDDDDEDGDDGDDDDDDGDDDEEDNDDEGNDDGDDDDGDEEDDRNADDGDNRADIAGYYEKFMFLNYITAYSVSRPHNHNLKDIQFETTF